MTKVGIGSAYKELDKMWVGVNGAWKEVDKMWAGVGGVWKEVEGLKEFGDILWEYTHDNVKRWVELFYVDRNGNIYIKYSSESNPSNEVNLIKFNSDGDKVWDIVIQDSSHMIPSLYGSQVGDIYVDNIGNIYIIFGRYITSPTTIMRKYSSSGILLWEKSAVDPIQAPSNTIFIEDGTAIYGTFNKDQYAPYIVRQRNSDGVVDKYVISEYAHTSMSVTLPVFAYNLISDRVFVATSDTQNRLNIRELNKNTLALTNITSIQHRPSSDNGAYASIGWFAVDNDHNLYIRYYSAKAYDDKPSVIRKYNISGQLVWEKTPSNDSAYIMVNHKTNTLYQNNLQIGFSKIDSNFNVISTFINPSPKLKGFIGVPNRLNSDAMPAATYISSPMKYTLVNMQI